MAKSDVQKQVDQYAAQYGVPAWIVEDIVQEESGYNTRAVGDHGTSFGLLQLHRGGQAGSHPTSELMTASGNLGIGMPYIAAGYKAAKAQGYTGWNLLLHTAGMSGHPGGSPGSYIMTSSYQSGLHRIFSGGGGAGSDGSGGSSSGDAHTRNPLDFGVGLDGFFSGIDNSMKINFDWTSPIASVMNDAGAVAFRSFFFICGLLAIIFGLALVVKKAV